MASSNFVRLGGGAASVASGVLLLLGHLLNLGGDPEYGTVTGSSLILVAHVILVFAFVALYAAQAESSGLSGGLGMVLSVAATTLICGITLVQVGAASGARVGGVLDSGAPGLFALAAVLGFFFGLILFGAATARAGVFPRSAGLLLIAGDVVFAAGGFFGAASSVVYAIGATILGGGLVWLGASLWRSGVSAERPARAS